MDESRRFKGLLCEGFYILKHTNPGYEELQRKVGEVIKNYKPLYQNEDITAVEIGCADGTSTNVILTSRKDISGSCEGISLPSFSVSVRCAYIGYIRHHYGINSAGFIWNGIGCNNSCWEICPWIS